MIGNRPARRPARGRPPGLPTPEEPEEQAKSCAHCGTRLRVCPSCRGHYDTGRLCQQCMFGAICPTCQRYWTWA